MAGHLHCIQTPLGQRTETALIQRPPIGTAIYSTWVASSEDTVGDRWEGMFWIYACQVSPVKKVGKIYRQRYIMKRPGLVNEVSMVVALFSTSSHLFSLLLFSV